MTAVKPATTKGPQTKQFGFHAMDKPWTGMQPDNNPAVLPNNALGLVINSRFRDDVMPRKGQHLYNQTPLVSANANITGLIDFQMSTRRSLYIVADGCPGISTTVGASIGIKDWEMEPRTQPVVYYNTSVGFPKMASAFGDLYVAVDNVLLKLQVIDGGYTEPTLTISGPSQDIPIFTFTGYVKVTDIIGFDGQLFIGLDTGVPGGAVFAFDSVTMHTNELLGLAQMPIGFALLRELLVMGFGGAPNNIRVRTAGASPGTWSTVSPGAGTITWRQGASYRDNVYITTGVDANVWKYDPTAATLSIFKTFGGGGTPITYNLCVHTDGFLYVTWADGTNPFMAKYDGTTWTDKHKQFASQFPGPSPPKPIVCAPIASYRGNVEVGCTQGDPGAIYTSPGDNTSSATWDRNIANGVNGSLDSFLVY